MVINWRRTSRLAWLDDRRPTLAAAGAALAQDKPTFYVIAPSLTDPFWITQQNGAKQAGEDFDVNVVFQAPAQDTGDAGMVPLVQGAIAAQPAGIAIDYTSKTMEGGRAPRSMRASRWSCTTTTALRARMRRATSESGSRLRRSGRIRVRRDPGESLAAVAPTSRARSSS